MLWENLLNKPALSPKSLLLVKSRGANFTLRPVVEYAQERGGSSNAAFIDACDIKRACHGYLSSDSFLGIMPCIDGVAVGTNRERVHCHT